MSDYDTWLTNEPMEDRFCPACMRVILDYEYDKDEMLTIASCECGWSGLDMCLLREWEVEQEYAIDRAEMMMDMRREGLL